MGTSSGDGSFSGCAIKPRASFVTGSAGLKNYLLKSTKELTAISGRVSHGETVDHDSRAWVLAQVGFIVETMNGDGRELQDELRSDLLQLLLAIANLNEQIRRQTAA